MYRDTINRGVARLDKSLGRSWVDLIDVKTLRISSCMFCVLGQIGQKLQPNQYWSRWTGSPYCYMLRTLGISRHAAFYGFNAPFVFDYVFLTWAWRRKIRKLQAERAVGLATQREYELAR